MTDAAMLEHLHRIEQEASERLRKQDEMAHAAIQKASHHKQETLRRLGNEELELAQRVRAASERWQVFNTAADEAVGHLGALDAEVRRLVEIAARNELDGKPFDPAVFDRIENTRWALVRDIPVRRRVAQLAKQELDNATQQLNSTRATITSIRMAQGKRVIS